MPKLDLSNVEKLTADVRIIASWWGDELTEAQATILKRVADTLEQQAAEVLRLSKEVEAAFKDGFVLGFDHRGRTDDPLEGVAGAERDWNHRATLSEKQP